MAAVTDVNYALTPDQHNRELRRAVIAATVGTTIEWYDFLLYSTMAGLVFGKLFFPNEDPLTATLNSFAIYFVGFVARPIGAFIFGHYGDRIGRKSTLIPGRPRCCDRHLTPDAQRGQLLEHLASTIEHKVARTLHIDRTRRLAVTPQRNYR